MNKDIDQEAVAREFDQYRDNYSEAVNEAVAFSGLEVDFFTEVKTERLIEIASARLGPMTDIRALDMGCGIGNYHARLSSAFGKLSGIDVSSESISLARERHPEVEYSVYGGHELPYEDRTYDLVFAICVMHHVPASGWSIFAKEMHRVLRPGGIAVVFEHSPFNPLTRYVVNRCPFDRDAVLLRPSKVSELFAQAGFEESQIRSIITVPPKGKLLKFFDDAFARLPFGTQYYAIGRRGET